jgi:signal peptidase I
LSASRSTFREYLEALLVAALFLGLVNTWIFKTFYIPSGSMEDTLLVGDHLVVNRFIYGAEPLTLAQRLLPIRSIERGDIVVFSSPEDFQMDVIKRCVGLPGDLVELRDKELLVNGEPVAEPFVEHRDPRMGGRTHSVAELVRRDQYGPFRVPEGQYFCLGDNRDFSLDSRFWGPVPRDLVKGRASVIYWSYGGETGTGEWLGTGHKMRQVLQTARGFFTKTRWSRTFHLPR